MTGSTKMIEDYLDELFPNPRCELNYNKDYELLLATMLSAQTTDKRVNSVTDILFKKYPTLKALSQADIIDVQNIIRPIGTYHKKAQNLIEIAKKLEEDYNNIFNIPCIAVDTHVSRVSKRLNLAKETDNPLQIEKKLNKKFKKEDLCKRHHQLVLFGRYYCLARNPNCNKCKLKEICKYYKHLNK